MITEVRLENAAWCPKSSCRQNSKHLFLGGVMPVAIKEGQADGNRCPGSSSCTTTMAMAIALSRAARAGMAGAPASFTIARTEIKISDARHLARLEGEIA
jgi:hypothetical protein